MIVAMYMSSVAIQMFRIITQRICMVGNYNEDLKKITELSKLNWEVGTCVWMDLFLGGHNMHVTFCAALHVHVTTNVQYFHDQVHTTADICLAVDVPVSCIHIYNTATLLIPVTILPWYLKIRTLLLGS